MTAQTHIWLKQIRGSAGKSKRELLLLKGLGLGSYGKESLLKDHPAVRGMVEKIQYLLSVEIRPGVLVEARKRGSR